MGETYSSRMFHLRHIFFKKYFIHVSTKCTCLHIFNTYSSSKHYRFDRVSNLSSFMVGAVQCSAVIGFFPEKLRASRCVLRTVSAK